MKHNRIIREYEQTTFETCLAVNLLNLAGKKINKNLEIKVIRHALEFSKHDFTVGHLDFMAKNFGNCFELYVDNSKTLELLNKIGKHEKISIIKKKITLSFINSLIEENPIIVYVDSYCLFGKLHCPHFITVIERHGNNYRIFDPWDGRIKTISSDRLSSGIKGLRNLLKFSPQIINMVNCN